MKKKKPTYKTELLTACQDFLKKREPGYGKMRNPKYLFRKQEDKGAKTKKV